MLYFKKQIALSWLELDINHSNQERVFLIIIHMENESWEASGNIIGLVDGNGQTITYHYNTLNKIDAIIDQDGFKETFTYDLRGNLLEHINRNGQKVHYEYNMYASLLLKRALSNNLN